MSSWIAWLTTDPARKAEEDKINQRNKMRTLGQTLQRRVDELKELQQRENGLYEEYLRKTRGNKKSPYKKFADDAKTRRDTYATDLRNTQARLDLVIKALTTSDTRALDSELLENLKAFAAVESGPAGVSRDALDVAFKNAALVIEGAEATNRDLSQLTLSPAKDTACEDADFDSDYAALMNVESPAVAAARVDLPSTGVSDEAVAEAMRRMAERRGPPARAVLGYK